MDSVVAILFVPFAEIFMPGKNLEIPRNVKTAYRFALERNDVINVHFYTNRLGLLVRLFVNGSDLIFMFFGKPWWGSA